MPMPDPADHWRRLGLDPGAGPDQIKAAFRRLAKEVHPDRPGLGADAGRFAAIHESYRTLMEARPAPATPPSLPCPAPLSRPGRGPGPGFRLIHIRREGLDLIYRLEGRSRRVQLPLKAWTDCPDCGPRPRADCGRCHGLGRVRVFRMVGLDLDQETGRMRLKGLGELGPRGPGDVIVEWRGCPAPEGDGHD